MPKRVFWPLALVVMGLIMLAAYMGLLPPAFWFLWPLILIVAGLGGLLISDREDWDVPKARAAARPVARAAAKPARKMTKTASRKSARKK
jgi:hypothetical protein